MKKKFVLSCVLLLSLTIYADECKIYRSGSYYYVSINGSDVSRALSSLSRAVGAARELNQAGMCDLPTPKVECKPYLSSNYYYASVDGNDITPSLNGLDSLTDALSELNRAGICYYPRAKEKCEVYHSGNYYYVRGTRGADVSKAFSSISNLTSFLLKFQRAGLCYANNLGSISPDNYYNHGDSQSHEPYGRLGFNFKERAFDIADTTSRVAKAIEPYLDNNHERRVDEIKKQAIRLKTKIQAGAALTDVRKNLYDLGLLLQGEKTFIENLLETDNLDSLGEDFLLALESIKTMVSFLDNDFKGTKSELY